MTDDASEILVALREILNWVRAASHPNVKHLLQDALPDDKAREVYQMSDGQKSIQAIRKQCKMSPNDVSALQQRCVSLGLMEVFDGKRSRRIFDLADFGLLATPQSSS